MKGYQMPLVPEDVQTYPRPPLLEPVTDVVRLLLGDTVLAETGAAWRVCETHHPPTYYMPPGAFAPGALVAAAGRGSVCEWKGQATYFDLVWPGGKLPRGAWAYPRPTPGFAPIADHVAVYLKGGLRGFVGGVEAQPQPGGFYGGWVTPNLTGRIKGAPGTEGW